MTLVQELLKALKLALEHGRHVMEDTLAERIERAIRRAERKPERKASDSRQSTNK